MKTNTFIFNFINPSRLVCKNPPPSPEHSTVAPSGTAPEAPAVEEKGEQAVQRAEGATLNEANRVYISASISNLKLLSIPDANQKVEKANAKLNRILARMEEIDKLRSSGKLTYVDQKEYEKLVEEKQSASKAAEQLQASLAEKTSELARLEDRLNKKVSKRDYTNPYAEKSSEKKREVVKANKETKIKVAELLANPTKEFLAFVNNADKSGKGWEQITKELLGFLGVGGNSKPHIKALQEVLFGMNVRNTKATDGKFGAFTLARLQAKVQPASPSQAPATAPTTTPETFGQSVVATNEPLEEWEKEGYLDYSKGQSVIPPEKTVVAKPAVAKQAAPKQPVESGTEVEPDWQYIVYNKSEINKGIEDLKVEIRESYADLLDGVKDLQKEEENNVFNKASKEIAGAYKIYMDLNGKYKSAKAEDDRINRSPVSNSTDKQNAEESLKTAKVARWNAITTLNNTIWTELKGKQTELVAWFKTHDAKAAELSADASDITIDKSIGNIIKDKSRTKVFDNYAELVMGCDKPKLSKFADEKGIYEPKKLLETVNNYILDKNAIALASLTAKEQLNIAYA